MCSSVDWSSLPAELLQTIAGNLKTIPDYIRFRSVCRYWRAAAELRLASVPEEFPRLMLSLNQSSDRRYFFNPLTYTHYSLPLPEVSGYRCIGSSFGRVILIDGSPDVIVLNPITGEKTHLPPLSSFPDVVNYDPLERKYELKRHCYSYSHSLEYIRNSFFRKVILTQDSQDPNKFSAFAISNMGFNHLTYCNHGDRTWSRVDGHWGYYEDAISFRGKLYLVDGRGSLAICEFNEHGTPRMRYVPVEERLGSDMKYLVDFMGKLLLVERYLTWTQRRQRGCHTSSFRVLGFDRSVREWKHVRSLGDCVLFVGQNSSIAVTASDYPGCKGNRIYFSDDYFGINFFGNGMSSGHVRGGGPVNYDVGAYNLDDGRIEWIPLYDQNESRRSGLLRVCAKYKRLRIEILILLS